MRLLTGLAPDALPAWAHALAVPLGVALLVQARALALRRRRAMTLAVSLLLAIGVLDLLKGLDIEEALLSWGLAALLIAGRGAFYVRSERGTLGAALRSAARRRVREPRDGARRGDGRSPLGGAARGQRAARRARGTRVADADRRTAALRRPARVPPVGPGHPRRRHADRDRGDSLSPARDRERAEPGRAFRGVRTRPRARDRHAELLQAAPRSRTSLVPGTTRVPGLSRRARRARRLRRSGRRVRRDPRPRSATCSPSPTSAGCGSPWSERARPSPSPAASRACTRCTSATRRSSTRRRSRSRARRSRRSARPATGSRRAATRSRCGRSAICRAADLDALDTITDRWCDGEAERGFSMAMEGLHGDAPRRHARRRRARSGRRAARLPALRARVRPRRPVAERDAPRPRHPERARRRDDRARHRARTRAWDRGAVTELRGVRQVASQPAGQVRTARRPRAGDPEPVVPDREPVQLQREVLPALGAALPRARGRPEPAAGERGGTAGRRPDAGADARSRSGARCSRSASGEASQARPAACGSRRLMVTPASSSDVARPR